MPKILNPQENSHPHPSMQEEKEESSLLRIRAIAWTFFSQLTGISSQRQEDPVKKPQEK